MMGFLRVRRIWAKSGPELELDSSLPTMGKAISTGAIKDKAYFTLTVDHCETRSLIRSRNNWLH